VKITDVKGTLLRGFPPMGYAMSFDAVFVRILTDEGIEGHVITYLMGAFEFESALPRLRSLLIGRDPHEYEAISNILTFGLERPGTVASAIDICLWDLIGKYHQEPIYRLLGAARTRVRAYASAHKYDTVSEYVDLANRCQAQGFGAFKIHGFDQADADIELCRAVRAAVGPDMDLMLDPYMAYSRVEALRVGYVLDELDFFWFEAPIPDSDVRGLADLCRRLKTPIAVAEAVYQGLRAQPKYLTDTTAPYLRAIGDRTGGISSLRKSAALCQAFNVYFEGHSYGPTLIQAAHFHVMLSILHCEFIEIPVPLGVFDVGMKDIITIQPDGFVEAPTKAGLGYEVDLDLVADATTRELSPT